MSESKKLMRRLERKTLDAKKPLAEAQRKLGKIYRQMRRESSDHYLRIQREIRKESKASFKYPINKVKKPPGASTGILGEAGSELEEEEFEPVPADPGE